jgi:hypothetical protein
LRVDVFEIDAGVDVGGDGDGDEGGTPRATMKR